METIRLQFQSNLKEKIMSFLESLPSKDVDFLIEDPHFEHNKKVLHKRAEDLRSGIMKTYSYEEVEQMFLNDEN